MRERDRLFAEEYIIDRNACAAAIRAGFSPKTAKDASEWIHPDHPTKPQVRALIDQLNAERSRRTGVTADRVLAELAKIAFVNVDDLIDTDTARVLPTAKRDDKAAIQSVTVKSGKVEEREVKLADKTRALELLGKHLGMFAASDRGQEDALGKLDDILKEFKNATQSEAT